MRRTVSKELRHIAHYYSVELGIGERRAYRRLKKDYVRGVAHTEDYGGLMRLARGNRLVHSKPWWRFW